MAVESLRVLAVSHAYPSRTNSSHGVFIHRLHLAMKELGCRIDVLQLAEWTPPRPISSLFRPWREDRLRRETMLDEIDGIQVHHPLVVTPRPSRFFSTDTWARGARTLANYCARRSSLRQADVVLGHFMVPDGYHAVVLGRALGLPTAAMAWGDDVHAWPERSDEWRDRLRFVLREVDLPIACSRQLVEDGNRWLERPRSDWHVVYGGVDLAYFAADANRVAARHRVAPFLPESVKADDHIILMLGQAIRAKGYIELLDAWREVSPHAPGWHLIMGGANGELDIAYEVSRRGLAQSAHWIGLQPANRVPDLLRASDAFVLASHNEGLSLSVLEAMATGLPTIATDVGGHAEVIRDPQEGWLIEAKAVAPLVGALSEVTGSERARRERGEGGRRAVRRIGSPTENARRLVEILARATEQRRERHRGGREERLATARSLN
jgi:glycosyltransferase involved in cell wall biosynthesis